MRTAAAAVHAIVRRRWLAASLRNSLNSWKHGLHELRCFNHGSASASRSLRKAILLRTGEFGHPTRCGFGNSRDRPCASTSKRRLSSLPNSSCSLSTCLLSLKSFRIETPCLPSASNCRPLAHRRPFTCRTPGGPQACEVHTQIATLLCVQSVREVLLSLSKSSHTPLRRRPSESNRPCSGRLPSRGWNVPDHAPTSSPEPREAAQALWWKLPLR